MNRRQKIVQKQFLNNEETVINRLKYIYDQSLTEITKEIRNLEFKIDDLTEEYDWLDDGDPKKEIIRSRIQSKIYQKQYQESLQKQMDGILKEMQTKQFLTVSDYLDTCYEDGFIGTIFDMHGQGVPLMMPLDQTKMVRAIQLESKISKGLYTKLGEDVDVLRKRITAEVSRSVATGASYAQCAKRLAGQTKIGYNKSVRIARTEGHRIQVQAAMDAMTEAKTKGADVVKQWDSTLDGLTRESHVAVDGEIREVDEPFSNGLMFPGDPAGGAAEVINCRCALLQRARWALDDEFTKWDSFHDTMESFDSPASYDEFKKGFFSPENKEYMKYVQLMERKYETKDFAKVLDRMTDGEYKKYTRLLTGNPLFNVKAEHAPVVKAVKTIADCGTVKEVESLFKSQGWFQVQTINGVAYDSNEGCAFDGIDLECAKSIYTTHERLFERYPQLIGKLNGTNTAKLGADVYAQCHVGFGNGGIAVNTKFFANAERLSRMYNADLSHGFHPVGTTHHSIVMHELGHAIDDYLTNTMHLAGMKNSYQAKYVSADLRPKVMKACGLKVADAGKEVSGYATKDHFEFFAECFAEYMDSDNPRQVATEFGKQFEELMKQVK